MKTKAELDAELKNIEDKLVKVLKKYGDLMQSGAEVDMEYRSFKRVTPPEHPAYKEENEWFTKTLADIEKKIKLLGEEADDLEEVKAKIEKDIEELPLRQGIRNKHNLN